jgi:hypothetical protein
MGSEQYRKRYSPNRSTRSTDRLGEYERHHDNIHSLCANMSNWNNSPLPI